MTLSTIALAFLDAIAVGEDNDPKDYNELVGGGTFDGFTSFPKWAGWRNSHAAGRYQFEPATWAGQVKKLGLKDFSPESQDIAAWDLAETVYKHGTSRDLEKDLADKQFAHVASALHSTWTSICPATVERFRGAYSALVNLLNLTAKK